MSQDETLQHTIAKEEIRPKKVLEDIEVSKECTPSLTQNPQFPTKAK
jgi:hypothetical protein